MKRIFTGLSALLWLAACAPAPVAPPSATATLVPPTPSPSPAPPTATLALTATPDNVAEASIFPKITAEDWQTGPANAKITFIEYGDYQ